MIVGQHRRSEPFMMRNCSSCERVNQPVVVGVDLLQVSFWLSEQKRQSDGEEKGEMERMVCW